MQKQSLTFILNENLDFPATEEPWPSIFSAAGIEAESTTDLTKIDQLLAAGGPGIPYVPGAAFCLVLRKNNPFYRGLVIATSKFTGLAAQRTLLVVRHNDPAQSLDDLEGSEYAYLNRSCSSSFFPPAMLLQQKGKQIDTFFKLKQVAGWQARVDAVVAGAVGADDSGRCLEDDPRNADVAKVIGEYFPCVPAVLIVRKDLDPGVVNILREHLLSYVPD